MLDWIQSLPVTGVDEVTRFGLLMMSAFASVVLASLGGGVYWLAQKDWENAFSALLCTVTYTLLFVGGLGRMGLVTDTVQWIATGVAMVCFVIFMLSLTDDLQRIGRTAQEGV